MLLSWRSGCDGDFFVAKVFSYCPTDDLVVEIGADSLALSVYIDQKLIELGEEIVAEILEWVDEGVTGSFVDEEKGVEGTTNCTSWTEADVAVVQITCLFW